MPSEVQWVEPVVGGAGPHQTMANLAKSLYSVESRQPDDPSGRQPRETWRPVKWLFGWTAALWRRTSRLDRHETLKDLLKEQQLEVMETFDTSGGGKVVVSFAENVDAAAVEAALTEALEEVRNHGPRKTA